MAHKKKNKKIDIGSSKFLIWVLGCALLVIIIMSSRSGINLQGLRGIVDNKENANLEEGNESLKRLIPTSKVPPSKTIAPTRHVPYESDPIINCSISANCGGGNKQLRQSVCNNSTCCQIGENWYFYEDTNKCHQDQNSYLTNYYKNNSNINNYPTWIPLPTFTPLSTPIPFPTYNSYENSTPTSKPSYPQMTKSQCQSNVNDKYRSQMNSYGCSYPCPESGSCGSSSVCEALWYQAQQEMSSCNQYN